MRFRWALLGVVLLAAGAASLPALDGPFLLDDAALLRDPLVLDPGGHGLLAWLASGRPLTLLLFAANHAAVGLDPRGWHLTSIAVHLAAVVLAFLLARRTLARAGLARPDGPALAAAGLFALHPLQVESVAYLSQRAEALASGLMLASLLALLRADEVPAGQAVAGAGRRRGWLLAGAALHALALLAKPIAATLPALWLLHAALLPVAAEAADPPWARVRRRLPAALPLLALSALAAWHGVAMAAGSGHAGYAIPTLPLSDWLATQARVVPTYLRLLAVPSGLCADWAVPPSRSFAEPGVLAGGLLLAAVAGGALWLARRALRRTDEGGAAARVAGFGALFFLVALAPSSSLVPLLDPLAEHRVYLASLGPFLALTAAATVLLRRALGGRAAVVGPALAALVLAGLAALTWQRSTVWASPLALWEDAAEKAPGKARVQQSLGIALLQAGRPADALAAFRRALALPEDGTVDGRDLLSSTVSALLALGRMDDARGEVAAALASRPGDAALLAQLARVEYAAGRDAEAERAARAALAASPVQPVAQKFLGLSLVRRGDLPGALAALRAAAAQPVLDASVYAALGRAEAASGNREAACAAWARSRALPGGAPFAAEGARALEALGCR